MEFIGVKVRITNSQPTYPIPYGKEYIAKGAYRQGKHIVVVGLINDDEKDINSTRIKYPYQDVRLDFIHR